MRVFLFTTRRTVLFTASKTGRRIIRGVIRSAVRLLLTVLAAVGAGCAFNARLDEENIRVIFPAIPAALTADGLVHAVKLVYTDKNGAIREQVFETGKTAADIRLAKNTLTPVLCYPLSKADGSTSPGAAAEKSPFFKPAGAIYPAQADGIRQKTLRLSWQDGFAADLLRLLAAGSGLPYDEAVKTLSYVNWERFLSAARQSKNPWLLDREKLLAAVTAQRLTVYSFSQVKQSVKTVSLPRPAACLFFSYVPDGFLLPENTVPAAAAGGQDKAAQMGTAFTLPLREGVNILASPDFITYISEENGGKRLVISTIPYYTE